MFEAQLGFSHVLPILRPIVIIAVWREHLQESLKNARADQKNMQHNYVNIFQPCMFGINPAIELQLQKF